MPTQNPYDPISRDVSGAEQWPGRPTAFEYLEKTIRMMMAAGYSEAEIDSGLEQLARAYVRPAGDR